MKNISIVKATIVGAIAGLILFIFHGDITNITLGIAYVCIGATITPIIAESSCLLEEDRES